MCKCLIEIRFDDNEFVRTKTIDSFSSHRDFSDENATFNSVQDETHIYPCFIELDVTYCPECELENERLSNISSR
jgi:hypothetical protein